LSFGLYPLTFDLYPLSFNLIPYQNSKQKGIIKKIMAQHDVIYPPALGYSKIPNLLKISSILAELFYRAD